MKIRQGFVSNSSSSSFLIVGLEINRNLEDLGKGIFQEDVTQEDLDEAWGGQFQTKRFLYCTRAYRKCHVIENDEPIDYIGINAKKLLQNNKTVEDIRKLFIEKAKELGFVVDPKDVNLYYGETNSE